MLRQVYTIKDIVCSVKSCTDTWGQLVLLTTILNHKTCINISRQVLEKTLFAINAIFSKESMDSE